MGKLFLEERIKYPPFESYRFKPELLPIAIGKTEIASNISKSEAYEKIRNKRKTLQVTVDEMRNFAFAYVEKYAPSKQQLKTYLLKKYMKLSSTDSRKKDVNKLIDIVLSDLEKNKFINDQFYSESKAKSMIQRGNSINKIRNYLIRN